MPFTPISAPKCPACKTNVYPAEQVSFTARLTVDPKGSFKPWVATEIYLGHHGVANKQLEDALVFWARLDEMLGNCGNFSVLVHSAKIAVCDLIFRLQQLHNFHE